MIAILSAISKAPSSRPSEIWGASGPVASLGDETKIHSNAPKLPDIADREEKAFWHKFLLSKNRRKIRIAKPPRIHEIDENSRKNEKRRAPCGPGH